MVNTLPTPASDQPIREQALDSTRSFIVQAPAGSGKTELLTQRYLRLLAEVEQDPEEIVAITFTRKAAFEMRARILKALRKAAAQEPVVQAYEITTRRLAEAVLQRDQQAGWQLLANHHRLRITTIDSLCASIVRQRPLLSGFGEAPAISQWPQMHYRQAVQALLADLESAEPWSSALQTLFLHLDNRLDVLEKLLTVMLAKREQWLNVVTTARQQGVVRAELEQALTSVRQAIITRVEQAFPAAERAALLELWAFANPLLQWAWHEHDWFGQPVLAAWQDLARWLLTDAGEWRKSVGQKQGFPAQKDDSHPASPAERKAAKQAMQALLERLGHHPGLLDALVQVQDAPPAAFDEVQWQVVQALVMVLPVLAAYLQVTFAQAGVVDFNEIGLAALHALGQEEAPTDVALALDARVRHWLIDEFQDTSQLQFQLLQTLTRGWQAGDGRTLFLVGDPMQSIYRFRQADVGLFTQAIEHGIGDVRLQYLALTHNFRSHVSLIDWFNREFAQVFPEQANPLTGAVNYRPSSGVKTEVKPEENHGVHWLWTVGQDTAAQVVETVSTLQQRYPQQSIAILVRSRSHLAKVLPGLQQANIAYQAVDLEALAERMVIQDLLSLTYALTHRADYLSWLALLRAPWCGLTLVDLKTISDQRAGQTVWQTLQKTELLASLSSAGQRRVQWLCMVLTPWIERVGRQPLRSVVEGAWRDLGGPQLLTEAVDLDNAETFLRLLEQQHDLSLDRLLLAQQLQDLKAAGVTSHPQAVQVMTIHKAKGLEFDSVIIPDLAAGARRDDRPLLLWQEQRDSSGGQQLLLAPIQSREWPEEPIYRYLWASEQQRANHEVERLLYVALTRAKQRLYLGATLKRDGAGAVKAPLSHSFLALLWPSIAGLAPQAVGLVDAEGSVPVDNLTVRVLGQLRQRVESTVPRLPQAATTPEPLLAVADCNHPSRNALQQWRVRLIGTVAHEVLAQWAGAVAAGQSVVEPGAWQPSPRWLKGRLISAGLSSLDADKAQAFIARAVATMAQDPHGQWILSAKHQDAHCEWPLWQSTTQGALRQWVIDRTFVADGVRWIIDYKFAEPTAGQTLTDFLTEQRLLYQGQLQRYQEVVQGLDITQPVRAELYFPLLQQAVEIIAV